MRNLLESLNSNTTDDELIQDLVNDFRVQLGMEPEDVVRTLITATVLTGNPRYQSPSKYIQEKYAFEPVNAAKWLNDYEYFGHVGEHTWEVVKRDFLRVIEANPRPLRLVLKGSIGWGKCVGGDTEFYDNVSGRMMAIKDAVGKRLEVVSEKEGKLGLSSAVATYSGRKECMRVELSGGYKITVSTDHPFRVREGWERAGELRVGDRVAVVRKYVDSDLAWERVERLEYAGVKDVYDLSVPETGSWVGNGIVLHNTFLSALICARLLYEIGCLRNPQAHYGLAPGTHISFMNLAVSATHARRVFFTTLRDMIDGSPWFNNQFRRRADLLSTLYWPQRRLSFVPGSSSELAPLGENLFGGVIEEANFFLVSTTSKRIRSPAEREWDQAKKLHDSIWRRMKSRYQRHGRVPGMLILNSSAKYPDDFLERVARENDKDTMVIEHAEWETKPAHRFSGRKMYVFVGDASHPPRICKTKKDVEKWKRIGRVVAVPVEYESDFKRDLEGAVRDVIGENVRSSNRFMTNDDAILEAFSDKTIPLLHDDKYADGVEATELTRPDFLNWWRLFNPPTEKERKAGKRLRPPRLKLHHRAPRYAHVDLGTSQDATGVCVVHIGEMKEVQRRHEDDRSVYVTKEIVPIVYVDLILRILPPMDGEIQIEDVRNLIYDLRDRARFRFHKITYDQYQSKQSQQTLQKRFGEGIVGHLSVDRTADQYHLLKEVIYEGRLKCYEYKPVIRELQQLMYDPKTGKVDHPPNGCFTGDTRISLLDGTEPMIKELAERESFWVYSVDDDGMIVIGKGKNARVTGRRQVMELVLDNYSVVRCTPDHLFMTADGTYIKAMDIVPNETSLFPLYRSISHKGGWFDYERVWQLKTRERKLVHHLVAEQFGIRKKGCVVHHIDGNKRNNTPENLDSLARQAHTSIEPKRRWAIDGHYADRTSRQQNHRIIAKRYMGVEEVWDIEVEKYHNFALNAGVFVHNSKDVADALAGAVWNAITNQEESLVDEVTEGIVVEPMTDEERLARESERWLLGLPPTKEDEEDAEFWDDETLGAEMEDDDEFEE